MSDSRGMGLRILVIDGERMFADVLAARLAAEEDVDSATVVGAVTSAPGGSVVGHADVLLLDADLGDGAAIRLCRNLGGRHAAPRVVMLSSVPGPERIVAAVRAGAAAWVRKDESMTHLLRVIRGVARGESWLPPGEMGGVLRLLLERRDGEELVAILTPRERQVLSLFAQGAGRYETAQLLHLSANTVRTHMQNLMAKLGAHTAVEAVALTRSMLDDLGPLHR